MDKNLYNFSVIWHNQKEQYLGRCAEFSFLYYLADTDLEAYQGILHLTCDFVEHIEKYQDEREYDQWFAANATECSRQHASCHITKTSNSWDSCFCGDERKV